jgi:hypothetical protein
MNVHVPPEIRDKWKHLYEFVGHPFIRSTSGRRYIRAKRKYWPWQGETHVYSFDDDFFYHESGIQDLP